MWENCVLIYTSHFVLEELNCRAQIISWPLPHPTPLGWITVGALCPTSTMVWWPKGSKCLQPSSKNLVETTPQEKPKPSKQHVNAYGFGMMCSTIIDGCWDHILHMRRGHFLLPRDVFSVQKKKLSSALVRHQRQYFVPNQQRRKKAGWGKQWHGVKDT